jgi:hypothetical protein
MATDGHSAIGHSAISLHRPEQSMANTSFMRRTMRCRSAATDGPDFGVIHRE